MTQSPNLLLNSLSAAGGAVLQAHLRTIDLPQGDILFDVGDPICSLSAVGDSTEQVRAALHAARVALLHTLETTS